MRTPVFFAAGLMTVFLSLLPFGSRAAQESAPPAPIEYLEFREVDIKDVLRQLARQYDLNIVFSESVKGLVTVTLHNVSIEQALDSIITVNGFAYTKKESVYKITTQDEAGKEGKQTKLFKLNNADAVKLKETLAKMLGPDGSVEADIRSNAIIVTDTLSTINKIEAMLPSLDETTAQVLIEAKLIETSLTDTEKLGIDWTTTISGSGASRSTSFPFQKATTEHLYLPAGTTAGSAFTFGTLDMSAFQGVLDVIKSRTNTRLVASPRIVTLNNQLASINVGKVVPIATYERNDTTGRWEITGWEQQNVGVNLQVTPQISPDGHIKLKLKPEVSNIIDYIGSDENRRPITSTRTAETEVIIKDGMTVVIAGLVKESDATTDKKIPWLGDLPLLGKLFSSRQVGTDEEPREKTDLLVFVTARILKEGEASGSPGGVQGRPFKTQTREINAK